ncbi:MAG TPA: hypothetical protein VLQ79_09410 [Myxococcaceae bacterium]|nr:hypothetical protein [Myxococcaceae bacterium]
MRRMLWMGCALLAASGCVVREYRPPPPPPVAYRPPPPPPAPIVEPEVEVAMQIEPPLEQPAPVAIPWAPPPMRWDPPPPSPYVEAVWVGGHWTWWNGEWVWARGHWARPPVASYVYSEPYYEYRGESVVFVAGFWRPMYRVFVPPPPTLYIPLVQVRVVHVGYARPMGPHGVFVPPPPGSQPGVIVPAPLGTPPAVVLSAPPVVRPGMVVRPVARGGVVEVVAPAGVTREGHPVTAQAPVVSRDAASVHPVVVAPPPPVRATPSPAGYDRGSHGVGPSVAGPGQQPGWNGQTGVTARPLPTPVTPEASSGQPRVQPMLKPDSANREGPVLRPVPPSRAEAAPRPPPARTDVHGAPPPPPPRTEAPIAQSLAPPAPRARPVPPKVEDRRPRSEPTDR